MPSELTLFFTDENGQERQVVVNANPFTMGRQEGNELVIKDASLSRRHALITRFNDVAQLSDCGSQNGTYLNSHPLKSATVLKHGDVITLGEDCHLRVKLTQQSSSSQSPPPRATQSPTTAAPKTEPSQPPSSLDATAIPQLSPALIAAIATIAIVLIAGGMVGLVVWKKSQTKPTEQQVVFVENTTSTTTTDTPDTPAGTTSPGTSSSLPSNSSDQFEKSLVQVIRNISNDQGYPFQPAVLADIKRKAEQFATPTLANTLRTISARGEGAIGQIKAQGLKKPSLLIYMALADTNGAGDPLAVAVQLVPEVQFLRGHFGSEFADQTLLVVAASKIPGGSKKSHPLLQPLRQLVKNPQTDRNVWYLRSKGALSDAAYDYVLRVLAYGAIAQNPRQFGLDAPALVF